MRKYWQYLKFYLLYRDARIPYREFTLVEECVSNSLKKYQKTYRLLEKYDQEAPRQPQDLAQPSVVQKYL
ncbi:MAG TPA: hypothetical protein VF209_05505 [Patescibacteria group bacterium]